MSQVAIRIVDYMMYLLAFILAGYGHFTQPASLLNYASVTKGMTKDQVTKVLGFPSDDKRFLIPLVGTQFPPPYEFEKPAEKNWLLKSTWSNWIGPNGTLIVLFDANGQVAGKAFVYENGYWEFIEFFRNIRKK